MLNSSGFVDLLFPFTSSLVQSPAASSNDVALGLCGRSLTSSLFALAVSGLFLLFGGKVVGRVGCLSTAIGASAAITNLALGPVRSIGHSMLATVTAFVLTGALFYAFTKSRRIYSLISGGTATVLVLTSLSTKLPLILQVFAIILGAFVNFVALPYNSIAIHLCAGVGAYMMFSCVNVMPMVNSSLTSFRSLILVVLWILGAKFQLSSQKLTSSSIPKRKTS
eukprot:TRINITY_DN1271_c0_g1_i1.p1 TRINITY_DN1271_c0_g1~~TRINITY_DN1271_c0_g1_i1.p1  ORF type:complete len:223 (-),score=47.26 TRINITY_DN1271_c0_g1_i1:138-806(-)